MSLTVRKYLMPQLLQRCIQTDGREYIVQRTSPRGVVVHIICGGQRDPQPLRLFQPAPESRLVTGSEVQFCKRLRYR